MTTFQKDNYDPRIQNKFRKNPELFWWENQTKENGREKNALKQNNITKNKK